MKRPTRPDGTSKPNAELWEQAQIEFDKVLDIPLPVPPNFKDVGEQNSYHLTTMVYIANQLFQIRKLLESQQTDDDH